MIVGLVAANGGQIYLDSREISQLPIHKRSQLGLSYLPQEASIFRGLTVEQNIMSVAELVERDSQKRRQLVDDLLAEFAIEHLRDNPR
jgi:lipopolysaccharide export system ATP-binding protein